jgi:hypothetical protein
MSQRDPPAVLRLLCLRPLVPDEVTGLILQLACLRAGGRPGLECRCDFGEYGLPRVEL